jgi:RNase P/RNase MRP subunit POP5
MELICWSFCVYFILIVVVIFGQEKMGTLFGDVGAGEAAALTKVNFYDPGSNIMIIRVSREKYRKICLALSCVTHVKGMGVMIRCLKVSSTARTCIKGLKLMLSQSNNSEIDLAGVLAVL